MRKCILPLYSTQWSSIFLHLCYNPTLITPYKNQMFAPLVSKVYYFFKNKFSMWTRVKEKYWLLFFNYEIKHSHHSTKQRLLNKVLSSLLYEQNLIFQRKLEVHTCTKNVQALSLLCSKCKSIFINEYISSLSIFQNISPFGYKIHRKLLKVLFY